VTTDGPRVLFIHGLESSPQGVKARFLAQHFETLTPSMDTSDFVACVRNQASRLAEFQPDVVVGSSFGGAVLLALVRAGAWRGPTVLLAPAARHYGIPEVLPEGVPVTVVHGTADDVVDIAGSRALAQTGSPGLVKLIELEDGHRLQSIIDDGSLATIVNDTRSRLGEGSPRGGA
jgi:predicted esterase